MIPFAGEGLPPMDSVYPVRRVRIIREFVGEEILALPLSLDIGERNLLGQALGMKQNTMPGDLNHRIVPEHDVHGLDLILFSEVFEHLMNPFGTMQQIRALLKPGGYCILATPVAAPWKWMRCEHHFTEYYPEHLRVFFEYMGFHCVKYRQFIPFGWKFMFRGVRPLLRVLFQRNQLWLLRKPE